MKRIKDRDVYALKDMDKAIRNCTCRKMMKANLDYLYDKYVVKGKTEWEEKEKPSA